MLMSHGGAEIVLGPGDPAESRESTVPPPGAATE